MFAVEAVAAVENYISQILQHRPVGFFSQRIAFVQVRRQFMVLSTQQVFDTGYSVIYKFLPAVRPYRDRHTEVAHSADDGPGSRQHQTNAQRNRWA